MINFSDKSEYECRELIERSEKFIHRYVKLLEKYYDLPACDEIIIRQLEKEFPRSFMDELKWDETQEEQENPPDAEHDQDVMDATSSGDMDENSDFAELKGLYESLDRDGRQTLYIMYQLMMNWGILHSVLLPDSLKQQSLEFLIAIARAVGNMNACFEALCDHNFNLGIVLSQRALELWGILPDEMQKMSMQWKSGGEIFNMRLQDIRQTFPKLEKFCQNCVKLKEKECGF